MKKVSGYVSVRALGCYDFELFVDDDATDEEIQKKVDETMELSYDYDVEEGYEEVTEVSYKKVRGCNMIVVDKLRYGDTSGFQPGVIYCINYNLQGTLCDQCIAKYDCQREAEILKNAFKELKTLSGSSSEIKMLEIKDYSIKDINRMGLWKR